MANYNRVILVGRLTRDIDLRYTQSGLAVTDIGLAVSEKRKSQSGEWVEETTFVDVTLWGRTAEVASEYLSKGSTILIEGRLKQDTWEQDGQKRSKIKVIGERMQMLGSRPGAGGGAAGSPPPAAAFDESEFSQPAPVERGPGGPGGPGGGMSGHPPEEDIPF